MNTERSVKIMFAFLGILLVLFVGLSIFRSMELTIDPFEYNGYQITPVSNGNVVTYQTDVFINGEGPFVMNSRNSPADLEDIYVDPEVYPYIYSKGEFSVAIDPTDNRLTGLTTLAGLEFNNYIEGFYQIPVSSAVTVPHGEFPVRSCDDGAVFSGLVILELADTTQVILDETCIRIQGVTEDDLVRASNRLGFGLVGIFPQ